jgi:PAS domain S-box-containing protein
VINVFRWGLQGKTTAFLGGIVFLMLAVISYGNYWQSKQLTEQEVLQHELGNSKVFKSTLEAELRGHQQNLLSLSQVPPIHGFMRARSNKGLDPENGDTALMWQQRLQTIFLSFAKNHPEYQQLRFIDAQGDELVRVDRKSNGEVVTIADDVLQNKRNSSYVINALNLKEGEFYFSDIGLNQEYGVVQVPYLPVFRIATPVFDSEKKIMGVVVMNLAVAQIFNRFTSLQDGIQRHIANNKGYFILHSDKSREFGEDLGFDYKLAVEEPYMAGFSLTQDQFIRHDEVEGELEGFQKVYFSPSDKTRYWLLLFHIPANKAFAKIVSTLQKTLLFSISIGLVVVLVVIKFTSKSVVLPILTMAAAYERLRAGDLAVRVDESTAHDEFLALFSGFNAFAENQELATSRLRNEVTAQTERLSAVINNIVDGIITISERGSIETFNRAACDIFGYEENEVMGENIKILMPAPFRNEHDGYLDNYLRTGEKKIIGIGREVTGLRKDGTNFPMELGVSVISIAGINRYVGIIRDITERKQVEVDLKKAMEDAEAASKSKGEFLASMSHEIRTPMNGVLGMLGLLLNEKLTEKQLHKVTVAQTSAKSLLSLINDILDFSKVDAGKLELEEIDFNLRRLLDEFAESMALRAQEKGLELIVDISKIEQSTVKGDPGRLRQILSNLVGNAIKFTETGEVIIRADLSGVADDNMKDEVIFSCSIIDTGIGIPKEKQSTLFDAFTQADASTTRRFGGTGLGLSIAKKLCEAMGGNVSLSSEFAKGSCFTFSVKFKLSHQTPLVVPKVRMSELNLLVVDDNKTNREVLVGQLEHWGALVEQAKDGPEALLLMRQRLDDQFSPRFDVAFLDMQMPGMDGAMLGKIIKADARLAATKLVMMTSMSDQGDAKYFADLGFAAYFAKPATTSDLFDALAVVAADGDALHQASPLVTHHFLQSLNDRHSNDVSNNLVLNGDAKDVKDTRNLENIASQWSDATRLLIVEDNQINQEVVLGILGEFGLKADVAGNGYEAINALKKAPEEHPYTFVLMDCQMPEKDGYEATRDIRSGKAGRRNQSIPIVAMTANAMKGDKEKCLGVGMNDYLSKPIDYDAMGSVLKKWIKPSIPSSTLTLIASNNGSLLQEHIWDKDAALVRLCGNSNLLLKLIDLYFKEMPNEFNGLLLAIENKKLVVIAEIAHKIKVVSANLNAQRMRQLVEQIEELVLQNNTNGLVDLLPSIKREQKLLSDQLWHYRILYYQSKSVEQSTYQDSEITQFVDDANISTETDGAMIQWVASRKLNILVVEDNEVNQELITTILEAIGHEVHLAKNGLIATEVVTQHHFDIVLMDIRMPVMDGVQATVVIRAMATEVARIPIIALTADITKESKKEFKHAGVNDICMKPLELAQLLNTIDKVLGNVAHTMVTSKHSTDNNRENSQEIPLVVNSHLDQELGKELGLVSNFNQTLQNISTFLEQQNGLHKPVFQLVGVPKEKVAQMLSNYETNLKSKCAELRGVLNQLILDPQNEELKKQAQLLTHTLKGNGSIFGYRLVTSIATDAENFLKENENLGESEIIFFSKKVAALSFIAESGLAGDGGEVGRLLLQALHS